MNLISKNVVSREVIDSIVGPQYTRNNRYWIIYHRYISKGCTLISVQPYHLLNQFI